METKTLQVVPNPFHQLDANGMPATLPRLDPSVAPPGLIQFIGTTMTKKDAPLQSGAPVRPERERRRIHTILHNVHDPVVVVATPFHVGQVRSGETLACDAETARLCKVKFVPVAEALAQSMVAAERKHKGESGQSPPVDQWRALLEKPKAAPEAQSAEPSPPIEWNPGEVN